MELKRDRDELLSLVRCYAREHYNEGWDVIVEAFTDDELSAEIGKATTLRGALHKLRKFVKVYKAYGDDIRASSGWY